MGNLAEEMEPSEIHGKSTMNVIKSIFYRMISIGVTISSKLPISLSMLTKPQWTGTVMEVPMVWEQVAFYQLGIALPNSLGFMTGKITPLTIFILIKIKIT